MLANRGSPSSCGGRSKPSAQLKSCVAFGVLPVPLPTSLPAASCGPEPPLWPLPAACNQARTERCSSAPETLPHRFLIHLPHEISHKSIR